MNLYEAAHLAKELMTRHGLAGWSFEFDHARRRFGRCDYTHRRITLSKPLTFLNPIEEVRDTLLHEIAHALAGERAGHGAKWRTPRPALAGGVSENRRAARAVLHRCKGDQPAPPRGGVFVRVSEM